MKLYATTTSERASKGQGGDYLDIKITSEDKTVLWEISVIWGIDQFMQNNHLLTLYKNKKEIFTSSHATNKYDEIKTKGKQKKDEDSHSDYIHYKQF